MKFNVVYGAPCSGKSTYCREKIGKNDIVYDYDMLARALTYGKTHTVERGAVHQYILDFRMMLIRRLKNEKEIENVWFISTVLTKGIRELLEPFSPNYIEIKTSKDECLKRLENDDERPDKKVWRKKIEEWFETYGNEERSGLIRKLENMQVRTLALRAQGEQTKKRIESTHYVEGYAATFDAYPLFEDEDGVVYEKFEKSAFDATDMSDVIFQLNHTGKVYARKSNKTLILEVDDKGLFTAADLSKTETARQMHEEIAAGLITKMSWAFKPGDYYYDKKTRTIVHTRVDKIYDVSAVSIPANDGTEINARDWANGAISGVKLEELEQEEKRKKLKLSIDLELED